MFEGMVYFIQAGNSGPIKVGISNDPPKRLATLQAGSSQPLYLLAAIHGGRRTEEVIHERFVERRLKGEWFAIGRTDVVKVVEEAIAGAYRNLEAAPTIERLGDEMMKLARLPRAASLDFTEIEAVFNGQPKVSSQELAAGCGYNPKALSVLLAPFGIRPRDMRFGEKILKGYRARDFVHIWTHLAEQAA